MIPRRDSVAYDASGQAKPRAWVHNLPTEMLVYIFKLGYQSLSAFNIGDLPPEESRNFELKVSSVCRRWRAICLAQPDMWATLCLSLADDYRNGLSVIALYVHRSKPHPINVWLTFSEHLLVTSIAPVLATLAKVSHRMRRLGLFFEFGAAKLYAIMHAMRWDFPVLESLEVDVDPADEDALPAFEMPQFPRLKYLRSSEAAFLNHEILPLTQLTTLYLESCGTNYNMDVKGDLFLQIMSLPNLTTLSLGPDIFHYDEEYPPPEERVTATKLLEFRCNDRDAISRMWRDVSFPVLELLVLEGAFIDQIEYDEDFDANIQYHHGHRNFPVEAQPPSLKTLALVHCAMAPSEALNWAFSMATASITHLFVAELYTDKAKLPVIDALLAKMTVESPHAFLSNVRTTPGEYTKQVPLCWPNVEMITYRTSKETLGPVLPSHFKDISTSRLTTRDHELKECLIRHDFWNPYANDPDSPHKALWDELHESGILQYSDRHSKELDIPWPRDRNCFSTNAELMFAI